MTNLENSPYLDAFYKMKEDLPSYINEMCRKRGSAIVVSPYADEKPTITEIIFFHRMDDREFVVDFYDDDILRLDFFVHDKDQYSPREVLHIHTLAEEIHIPAIWILFDIWFLRRP